MRALCTKSESFTRLLDEEECYQQVRRLRWPDGKVRCPCCPGCAPYHNMSEGRSSENCVPKGQSIAVLQLLRTIKGKSSLNGRRLASPICLSGWQVRLTVIHPAHSQGTVRVPL
ncbi:MAG: transposase [Candidatus Fervidibacter sp.]